MDRQMDRQTDGQAQTNMPPQFLRSWGHNKRPALPKYNSSWDPEIVLNYLKSLHQPLPLIVLSQKLCILLLLISAHQGLLLFVNI